MAATKRDEDAKVTRTIEPRFGRDAVLITDIVGGAVLGYFAIFVYHTPTSILVAMPQFRMMMWRELLLISVIGALAVARADPTSTDNAWSNLGAIFLGIFARAACAGTLLLTIGLVTGAMHDLARLWLIVWASLFIGWMCFSRLALLAVRRHISGRGGQQETILVIGGRDSLSQLLTQLAGRANIVGVINHTDIDSRGFAEALTNVVLMAREGAIGLVVIVTGYDHSAEVIRRIVDCLQVAPLRIALYAPGPQSMLTASKSVTVCGIAMTLLADRPLTKRDMFIKISMDRMGATLMLLMSLPLLLAIALAILFETGGPIIFEQRRNGWCGRLFTVYKFRTMRHAPGQHVHFQTMREDPRCTRVGSFLRRTSLDELPQLWNVLRGDMSLVGPRPHADFMHARERVSCGPIADYAQRQRVKPGLTGWAQVHGLRGAADTPEKLRRRVEFDRFYIDNWSVWLDLKILAHTPWAVILKENAF